MKQLTPGHYRVPKFGQTKKTSSKPREINKYSKTPLKKLPLLTVKITHFNQEIHLKISFYKNVRQKKTEYERR